MTDQEMIDIVKEYGEFHDSFDLSFVESLEDALSEYNELTYSQRDALDNIITKFRMIKANEKSREDEEFIDTAEF